MFRHLESTSFRSTLLFLVVTLTALPFLHGGEESGKKPVPEATSIEKAVVLVQEVYGDEYRRATKLTEKIALVEKLLRKAKESAADPPNHFALLRVARDMAVLSGDVELGLRAVDDMASVYEIDVFPMQVKVLLKASKSATQQQQYAAIVNRATTLIERAVAFDKFETAHNLVEAAQDIAKKSGKKDLASQITASLKAIATTEDAYRQIQGAMSRIEQAPTDPESNLAIGRYHCLVKGNWDKGLPMLALGSDASLKTLATQELQGAKTSDAQMALGDGWWQVGEASDQKVFKRQAQLRAVYWYKQASPQLAGLVKDKVDKRIKEVAGEQIPVVTGPVVVDLLPLAAKDKMTKSDLVLGPSTSEPQLFLFPYQPPKEYDLELTITQTDAAKRLQDFIISLPQSGNTYHWCMRRQTNGEVGLGFFRADKKPWFQASAPLPQNRNYSCTLLIQLRDEGAKYFWNGKVVATTKGFMGLHTSDGTQIGFLLSPGLRIVVHKAQVREVTGKGKIVRAEPSRN